MKLAILSICILLNCISMAGDISTHMVFDNTISGPPAQGIFMPFTGTLDFNTVPTANGICDVEFELEIVNDIASYYLEDWLLGISYDVDGIILIDHSDLDWPGSHKDGDKFKGSFSFKTIKSGEWQVGVYVDSINNSNLHSGWGLGLNCEFCIDQDGILHRLIKYHSKHNRCYQASTVFMDKDTVVLTQKEEHKDVMDLQYEVTLQPRPKINDTTVLLMDFVANANIDKDMEAEIYTQGVEIISAKRNLKSPMYAGDSGQILLEIMPLAVNAVHIVSINIKAPYAKGQKGRQFARADIVMLFGNDNNLKYANLNGKLSYPPELTPTIYRDLDNKRDRATLKLMSDGRQLNSWR